MADKSNSTDEKSLFLDSKNPVRSLTWAYVLALGIIAFLTLSSHAMTAHIASQQQEGAEVAYHLGRQRGLVQDVTFRANEYYKSSSPIDLDFLNLALREMEQGHTYLEFRASNSGLFKRTFSKALYEMYHEEPYALHGRVNQFIETATRYANTPPSKLPKQRQEDIDYISKTASIYLIRAFDTALEKYQQESVDKMVGFYNLQFWSGIIILIVLCLEAMFIFQPLVKRISKYHQILLRDALIDELTKLYNRRAFMKQANVELNRSRRHRTPLAIVLTDLDKFKLVNDTYGHEVGDAVLMHFAGIVRSSLRSEDTVGRIGGEEFALILPNVNEKKAFQIVDRLRKRVAETPCLYNNNQDKLPYTASFGLIIAEPGNWSIDRLLKEADNNLYEAKENGRNRVVVSVLKAHAAIEGERDGERSIAPIRTPEEGAAEKA